MGPCRHIDPTSFHDVRRKRPRPDEFGGISLRLQPEMLYMVTETTLNGDEVIEACLCIDDEWSLQEVKVLNLLRSQRSDISRDDLETAVKTGTVIYLQTLDSTNLQNFFKQLGELLSLSQKIERDELPIRLVDSYADLNVSAKMIQRSIALHRSREFKVVPSISSLLSRLEAANWLECRPIKIEIGYKELNELPSDFRNISETIFSISYHIGQRLADADYHTYTIAHCIRIMNGPVNELVQRKLHGCSLTSSEEFLSIISSIVNWACVQLFYEPDGRKEFVQLCDLISCGYLPVGWEGRAANGRLLLYRCRDSHERAR